MPFLQVSSFDRDRGTDADCLFDCALQDLGGPNPSWTRMRIAQMTLCNFMYNVDASNDTLRISEQGQGNINVSVSWGSYTTDRLMANLQASLRAESYQHWQYTVTQSELTGLITINAGAGHNFSVLPPTGERTDGLNQLLGFSMSSPTDFSTIQTGSRMANMQRFESIYLQCDAVRGSTWRSSNNQQTNALTVIPVATIPWGSIFNWQPLVASWRPLNNPRFSSIGFQLRDERNRLVDLRGGYWTATIELE